MRDLKSYSYGRKKSGSKFLKIILLIVVTFASIGLYLVLYENEHKPVDNTVQPTEAIPTPEQQSPDRITVPLSLPDHKQEEGRALSEPADHQLSKKTTDLAQTRSQPIAQNPFPEISDSSDPTIANSHTVSHKIVPGDNLSNIFKKIGLSTRVLHKIVHSSKTAKRLTNIKPGEILHLELDQEHNLQSLTLEHDKIHSLRILAADTGFHCTQQTKDLEQRTAHVQGIIEHSLYLSAKQAGLPEAAIMELAKIFGWDIDFALEIRSGDSFSVIYQEEYLHGEKYRTGPILAADFIKQGRSYRAVRDADNNGKIAYFTPEGHSMRKAFLRAPVDFRRISSHFAKQRWHPVSGKKRPHRGVDYAASIGTPIKAAGDGKVIHRAKKGGYGHTVIIQHAQGYTTLYAHLSRYSKSARLGSKVKQGQVIGYVGQSGLATGPHLHYEFRVNGVHRNPLTVKLPNAQPIAKQHRADFILEIQPLVAQLDILNRTRVADAR
jgi:murein DD-endopeptidase MepM/ murein hydrolase activator NlpD